MRGAPAIAQSFRNGDNMDQELISGLNLVPGVTSEKKFGYAPALGTSYTPIWYADGTATAYTFPTSGTTMTLSSASADDTSAGTGARTVVVSYINDSYEAVDVTVTMNGQTGVQIATDILHINRMRVATAGTRLTNAGIIYAGTGTVTSGKPANIYGSIGFAGGLGFGQTLQSIYMIPAGVIGVVYNIWSDIASAKESQVCLQVMPFGGAWNVKWMAPGYAGEFSRERTGGLRIEPKSRMRMMGKVVSTTAAIGGGFEICLVEEWVLEAVRAASARWAHQHGALP